jgi:hypothetical protein
LKNVINVRGLALNRTYRLLPRHCEFLRCIINSDNITYINNIPTFQGSHYAGTFDITHSYPQRVGVITDIVDDTHVYVVLRGSLTNIFTDLTIHRTYILDIHGRLHDKYHDVNEGKSFLIAGNETNKCSLVYNGL